MRPIEATREGATGLGGGGEGGWGKGGACLQDDRTPAVEVRVSRFLRHPTGHTVYQVDVHLMRTRQVRHTIARTRLSLELDRISSCSLCTPMYMIGFTGSYSDVLYTEIVVSNKLFRRHGCVHRQDHCRNISVVDVAVQAGSTLR